MEISLRAKEMPASPIRKTEPYATAAMKKGLTVYGLNVGQPDIETPPAFFEAVRNFPGKVVAYQRSQGDLEYLEALAGYYRRCGYDVSEEDIVVTTGGSEAIIFAAQATTSVGDEIIVFEPFYTNYNGYAVMCGVKLVPVTTRAEDGYHLPPKKEIASKITPRTRAILVCSPNNPTGTVLRREEMEMLAEIALEKNLFIISDEVYREFVYEGEHTGILELPGLEDRAILMDSISKRYSMCGARIGCVVSRNRELISACIRYGQARLCSPTLEQHGAIALTRLPGTYFDGVRAEYRKRRDLTIDALQRMDGVMCRKPKGAFYVMARLPIDDTDEFAKWLLTDFHVDNETVRVSPGAGFYATPGKGKDEIRLAYVLENKRLERALYLLERGIKEYNRTQVD
ncbi:MAG: pyridoxal phosphate-dependent aminotransferase [Planctomycetota bacterium]|nr:MAG: pyridoxal phosphate-dependent aminotransferase [Planctomycetota bacterium]